MAFDIHLLSATIEEIYAAVGDVTAWNRAGWRLAQLLDSQSGTLLFIEEAAPEKSFGISSDYGPADILNYVSNFYGIDPMQAYIKANRFQDIISATSITPFSTLRKLPFYDFMHHYGFRNCLGGSFLLTPERYGFFSVVRNKDYTHDDYVTMRLIRPHLRQAVAMHSEWLKSKLEEQCNAERAGRGMALVSPEGHLIYANAGFQPFITADVFRLHQGRLVVPAAPAEFKAHLQTVFREGMAPGRPSLASMRIGVTPDAQIHTLIRPFVLANQLEGPFIPRKCLLISVIDPSSQAVSNLQAFATVYGLTLAEMDVLRAFADGYSPTEIAVALGSKQDRVKFHLKNIYRKTNVGKQTDLARLLAQF